VATQKELLQAILDQLKGGSSGTSTGPATTGPAFMEPSADETAKKKEQAAAEANLALTRKLDAEQQRRDQERALADLTAYNKELGEQEKALDVLKKQYSGLTQGITSKYNIEAAEAAIALTKELARLAKEYKKGKQSLGDYREAQQKATNAVRANTDRIAGQKGMSEALTRVGTSMTGVNLKSGSLTEKMVNLGNELKTGAAKGGSMKTAMWDMTKSITKGGLLKAVELVSAGFTAFGKITTDFFLSQDKAVSSFRRATGAGKEYNLQIAAVSASSRQAGVTAGEQGKAYEELYTSMSSFTELNQSEQKDLVETTTLLGKMGISGGTTAKIFDQMTRTLGKGPGGAKSAILDLAGAAKSIGVPMGKMTQDFAAAFGELSKFGDGAMDVFKSLSVQSKKTGIEVSRLMAITKKFDTFEGAATAVGKLNAILGGPYLNSIDMLNASESERIEQIRTTLQLSGQQFEALNRFEKMAIADALGMSVEETGRLMSMSTAEMQMSALEADKIAADAAAMQDIMTRIKAEFSALAQDLYPVFEDIIGPGIEKFSSFISAFAKVTSGLSVWQSTFAAVGAILMGMVFPLAAMVAIMGGPVGWGIAAAMIGGTLVGAGLAASAVTNEYDEVQSARGANKKKRTGKSDGGHVPGLSDGGFSLDSVQAADYVFASEAYGPSVRVNMNEFGKEGAILPDGTYVATATDMKDSIAASQLVARELAGLRADIQKAAGRPVHLMVEDGREFASHIVNNAGMSPFLVG
jgi:tetratricopeptide (TPR) repeat protein